MFPENLVQLKYTFIFQPQDMYGSMNEFERDLEEFFASKGVITRSIKPIGPSDNETIVALAKRPQEPPRTEQQPKVPSKTQLRKDFNRG